MNPSSVLGLLRRFGIDRAVAYSLLSRVWLAGAGLVSMVLLTRFLTPNEQGFYYTFASVLGLQIFFELGVAYVVLQFASHESAHLEWTPHGTLEGDARAKARLSSLLRLGIKWYGVVALGIVAVVLPAGFWFFAANAPAGAAVGWQVPWLWVVLASAGTVIFAPAFAILQGCGLVAEVAQIRLFQAVSGSVLFWLALTQGWGLLAAPIVSTVGVLWSLGWVLLTKRAFLRDLLGPSDKSAAISWRREIWPLQWKIAVSWLSGYFIFQLFNPMLFAFAGAAEAGRMGLSVAAMGALAAVASVWVETKLAPFGNLIALRRFQELDRLFFVSLRRAFAVASSASTLFWGAVWFLNRTGNPLAERVLDPLPLALLIVTTLLNFIVGAEAAYLRAYKQEPFLGISILTGVLVSSSTYLLGRAYGVNGMMIGYLLVTLFVGLGGGTWIFQQKRRLWQSELTPSDEPALIPSGVEHHA